MADATPTSRSDPVDQRAPRRDLAPVRAWLLAPLCGIALLALLGLVDALFTFVGLVVLAGTMAACTAFLVRLLRDERRWVRGSAVLTAVAGVALILPYPELWARRVLYWTSPEDRCVSLVSMWHDSPLLTAPELSHALKSRNPLLKSTAAHFAIKAGDIRGVDALIELYRDLGENDIKLSPREDLLRCLQLETELPRNAEIDRWWAANRARAVYVGNGHWRIG